MAVVDVGDAAMAGPRVVISHPVAVLVWGLMVMGFLVAALLVFGGGVAGAVVTLAQSSGRSPDPSVILGLIGSILGFYFVLLIGMAYIFWQVVRLYPEIDWIERFKRGDQGTSADPATRSHAYVELAYAPDRKPERVR